MEAFHEWFSKYWPEPPGSRQKRSNHTFKRKIAFDAWVAADAWVQESFSKHMAGAVDLGEIDRGTAQYCCEVLKSAAEEHPMVVAKCRRLEVSR